MHLADLSVAAGDFARGTARYQEVRAAAALSGDDLLALRADLEDATWRLLVDPTASEASALTLADRVYALAEARGNTSGLVRAEMTRAEIHLGHCRWMDDLAAVERARALLGPNDDPRLGARVRADMCNALRYGPVPAVEAIDRIEALSRESGDSNLLIFTSALFAMLGQADEGRARFSTARRFLDDRGLVRLAGTIALHSGSLERFAGDLEAADAAFADGIAILQSLGETGVLSTLAAMRAGVLVELGRARLRPPSDSPRRMAPRTTSRPRSPGEMRPRSSQLTAAASRTHNASLVRRSRWSSQRTSSSFAVACSKRSHWSKRGPAVAMDGERPCLAQSPSTRRKATW